MSFLVLDQSILPGYSGNQSNRTCIPGDKLYPANNYLAGTGCYEFHGSIYAALAGYVYVFPSNNSKNPETNVVEVRNTFDKKSHTLPFHGSIVTARVEVLTIKFAKCSIICVEDTLLTHEFNSTLRKEDIRDKEKDKVELFRCVQPGDLILARVLGYGDSQAAYLLSIAENELGVIHARGQNGERLVPHTSGSVKAVNSDYKEERKVAVIPSVVF